MYKKKWEIPTEQIQNKVVKTGYLSLSSPELTAMDLLLYQRASGGLNAIATILSELIEAFDPARLLLLLSKTESNSWWQRLGSILEKIEVMDEEKLNQIIQILRQHADKQTVSWVPLAPGLSIKGMKRNSVWKVIENTDIEGDL